MQDTHWHYQILFVPPQSHHKPRISVLSSLWLHGPSGLTRMWTGGAGAWAMRAESTPQRALRAAQSFQLSAQFCSLGTWTTQNTVILYLCLSNSLQPQSQPQQTSLATELPPSRSDPARCQQRQATGSSWGDTCAQVRAVLPSAPAGSIHLPGALRAPRWTRCSALMNLGERGIEIVHKWNCNWPKQKPAYGSKKDSKKDKKKPAKQMQTVKFSHFPRPATTSNPQLPLAALKATQNPLWKYLYPNIAPSFSLPQSFEMKNTPYG